MNKISKLTAITITAAFLGMASLATVASDGEYGEGCERGEHKGQHMGKHKGKHKGSEMAGKKNKMLDLSADEVEILIKAQLIKHGNDQLKVGKVEQKDDQTYVVDIVTIDDSLVRQIEVDKDKGPERGKKRH